MWHISLKPHNNIHEKWIRRTFEGQNGRGTHGKDRTRKRSCFIRDTLWMDQKAIKLVPLCARYMFPELTINFRRATPPHCSCQLLHKSIRFHRLTRRTNDKYECASVPLPGSLLSLPATHNAHWMGPIRLEWRGRRARASTLHRHYDNNKLKRTSHTIAFCETTHSCKQKTY